jgi:hypothetical protein
MKVEQIGSDVHATYSIGQLRRTCCIAMIGALLGSGCLASATSAWASEPAPTTPDSGPWSSGKSFSFERKEPKTRRSLSGIACPVNESKQRVCLVVFDEGIEARYVVLKEDGYSIDDERVILRKSIGEAGELDAEGATTDGRFFYVTGSHSVARGDCEDSPGRRRIIRFRVDGKTGRALREPAGDPNGSLIEHEDRDTLWVIMGSLPQLKASLGKCLGAEGGVNIEGIAAKDGRLYFGFRGPTDEKDGSTFILSVNADALFTGTDARPEVTRIVVGKGRGIRDLISVKDGFLVLAGPDDDKTNKDVSWIVALWDGMSAGDRTVEPKALARLDLSGVKLRECDEDLKPEALAVIEDAENRPYRVVILSDGMCDGGPLAFAVQR